MSAPVIRIATRSSQLALWQAEYMKAQIESVSPQTSVQIIHISTIGDQNQTDPLRQFGGTGVFTREVQTAVLSGHADIAVHSLKDLQTEPTEGLTLAGIPERAPRFDALLLPNAVPLKSLDDLPTGAKIGTGSPRRQAQLMHCRPDLQVAEIRGNVGTRIRKLDDGEFDAIILAEAGLRRLELQDRISLLLEPPTVYPAVGQGALGVECRDDDHRVRDILTTLTDERVKAEVTAERSLLSELRAGCHAPLGALSVISDDVLTLTGVLLSADGVERLEAESTGAVSEPAVIGVAVAAALLKAGGDKLVAAF